MLYSYRVRQKYLTILQERPRRDADPSTPSSAVDRERVELYLYSPYGPYGLYRASVPVQGCNLPYLYSYCKHRKLMLVTTYQTTWCHYLERWFPIFFHLRTPWQPISKNCTLYITRIFII